MATTAEPGRARRRRREHVPNPEAIAAARAAGDGRDPRRRLRRRRNAIPGRVCGRIRRRIRGPVRGTVHRPERRGVHADGVPGHGHRRLHGEDVQWQAAYTGEVKAIKALDAKTVEFDLCVPDVAFLSKVAFSSFAINDTAYLTAHVADGSIVQTPNGTGPYMLKEWVKGDHITLAANPNWTGTPVLAQTVVVKWSTEAAQRLHELQAGTVDGIDNVGPTDFDTVNADSTLKLYPREGLNTLYLGMNVADKPFDNEKVRQAIAMGIDKAQIVKNFYPGGSSVADYFTPCSIPNGCVGDPWYTFDPGRGQEAAGRGRLPERLDDEAPAP